MARVFIGLKLRLIRNSLRGGGFRLASFILGALLAGQFALAGFAFLAAPPRAAGVRPTLPVLVFTFLFVGWLILPVFGYGLDETLDPDRLTLLPLSRRGLMTGLFAASATGIAPVASLVGLSGAIIGYSFLGPGTAVVAVAVLIEFALCLVAARAVTTALARILRSRRARDFWAVGFSLFVVVANGLLQAARLLGRSAIHDTAQGLAGVLRWFPPGMAGRAVVDADAGRLGVAALQLVGPVAALILLGLWWAANLERLLTSADEPSSARRAAATGRPERGRGGTSLYPRLAWFLPRDRRGAVAAKDLLYLWREPAQRAQRLMTFVFALAGIVAVALFPKTHRPPVTLASTAFLWFFSLMAMGQFGIDRTAYWMNLVAGGDPEDDLVGKNIAIMTLNLPVFLLLAVVLAALTGGWLYLPVALAAGAGALGVALGVGNVTSVRLAQPMPESTTNLWAQRTGQGCGTGLVLLLVMVLSQLIVAPIGLLLLLGLRVWPPLLAIAVPFSLGYGWVLYGVGRRIAGDWLRGHQPELLEALSPQAA